LNYKEKLIKQAEYYSIKRTAILDTIRKLEVKKEDSDAINWGEVNGNKVQQDTIDYLIDAKLQDLLNESVPVEKLGYSEGDSQPVQTAGRVYKDIHGEEIKAGMTIYNPNDQYNKTK
jgi:hypothetical protein